MICQDNENQIEIDEKKYCTLGDYAFDCKYKDNEWLYIRGDMIFKCNLEDFVNDYQI